MFGVNKLRNLRSAVFFTAACLVGALSATYASAGMQVAPLIIEKSLTPGESGSFSVRNTGVAAIPIEITIVRREIDADGNTINVPADGDFVIFPPQASVPGSQTQIFRFQYLGDGDLARSHSYYFYATQLPVDLEADTNENSAQARIDFLYEYGISVHMIPDGAEPNLVVTNAAPGRTPDGRAAAALTIKNFGDRFGRASEHELRIKAGGKEYFYSAATLKQGLNNGMWLPDQSFEITFPVENPSSGPIEATLTYVGE